MSQLMVKTLMKKDYFKENPHLIQFAKKTANKNEEETKKDQVEQDLASSLERILKGGASAPKSKAKATNESKGRSKSAPKKGRNREEEVEVLDQSSTKRARGGK